ncbi:unnamed protein product [Clonostachys rhizophaga]|uniref:Uncharacterized protein n=1 Tax=Clonostachys rhizophaga TaxID=160324 RepID=A0A9N9YPZ3_9HYPO|nr:unnamed protein product [Clonostachys rhizophaga]
MLAYSERSQGLTTARIELASLWRFGPPAVLTIVSTLWARVEFQTLRYFPWMTVHKDTMFSGHHITSLDYTSLILPKVIFLSLKRKDFLVCLASVLAMLMKAQVVLSANLFYDKALRYSSPLEIELLDTFQTSHELDSRSNNNKSTYFAARAFHDFHMNPPFGVAEQAAYQTFKPAGSDTVTRGTSDMPITVTVDALFTDIQCLPMKEFESSVARFENTKTLKYDNSTLNFTSQRYRFTFDILFEGCDRPVHINVTSRSSEVEDGSWTRQIVNETPTPCSSLPTQFPSFVYLGHLEKLPEKNRSMPVVKRCAAIICSPTAWVSKVEIQDDGIKPVLRRLPDKEIIKVNSNPWNLLSNIITFPYGNVDDGDIGWPWAAGPLGADSMWLGMDNISTTDESLYQNERLIRAVQNLTRVFGPFASNGHLRENNKSSIIGSRIGIIQKLQINQRICIAMAVIFLFRV